MSRYDCYALSEKGAGRKSSGDSMATDARMGIFAVADGVSGHAGGPQASRAAVDSFMGTVRGLSRESRADAAELERAVGAADRDVRAVGAADPSLAGLGTTLSAVVLSGGIGTLVHAGDSRVYQFSAGALRQLTRDHTLLAELIAHNLLTAEQAKTHPLRHMLARSLGGRDAVEADIADVSVQPGDWLILATDGLAEMLSEERLRELLRGNSAGSAQKLCEAIMEAAQARPLKDDTTIVAVRFLGGRSSVRMRKP
ncbi:MAG: protein phosphatase 2C domain-containing protein [Planctomycetota bacterium]|nr:protein phosphatase 2C domain-containing protein [Planctomycetota bacterium]